MNMAATGWTRPGLSEIRTGRAGPRILIYSTGRAGLKAGTGRAEKFRPVHSSTVHIMFIVYFIVIPIFIFFLISVLVTTKDVYNYLYSMHRQRARHNSLACRRTAGTGTGHQTASCSARSRSTAVPGR